MQIQEKLINENFYVGQYLPTKKQFDGLGPRDPK